MILSVFSPEKERKEKGSLSLGGPCITASILACAQNFIIVFVIFLSGAIKAIACGRMLISKNKMVTGDPGPNLAPVPGHVELVCASEHASAIIQRECTSYHAHHLGTDQKMLQYYAINVRFHKVTCKTQTRKTKCLRVYFG